MATLTPNVQPCSRPPAITALTVASASPARAQTALDRVVGRTGSGTPLIIRELSVHTIGALALAAGVPMGLELAQPENVRPWALTATRLTLRAVLDAIVAADSRYEWREDDGVVVFRPVASWLDGTELLDIATAQLKLEDMQAADALIVLAQLFGANRTSLQGPGDTKHFSIDLPPGRVYDALNGIVRAHGTMAWTLAPPTRRQSAVIVSLMTGASGVGFGIPRDALARRGPSIVTMVSRPRPADNSQTALLDRIVGPRRDGHPLILQGLSDVPQLAMPWACRWLSRCCRRSCGTPCIPAFPASL